MTNWTPDLSGRNGPRYRAIAEALAEDVRAGRLAGGTQLPTQRDLAWKLRVTIGTVSRAYAEAERRGLIGGEVGRGTYVRHSAGVAPVMPGDILGETAGSRFHRPHDQSAQRRRGGGGDRGSAAGAGG